VAEDTRRDTISNNDVWNMSVKGFGWVHIVLDRIAYAMKGDMELMLAKVRSPYGMFYIRFTVFLFHYRFDLHISVCVG
jgi:hypothetical protein